MQTLREHWQKLSDKSKKMLMAITGVTAVVVILAVVALKFGFQPEYATLFAGLNQEDAQAVMALLQEDGVSYRYDDKSGDIQVLQENVDITRAQLLSQGYPKSGFTYDMYRDNAGLMTTESDKKQYTLYELQNRLGAQICLFDGVRDAKVTIVEAGEQKYALSDTANTEASASVVVTMERGETLTSDKAASIKNLIARAVRGMTFTNVAVFDAETMLEVGGDGTGDSALSGAKDMTALTSLVENNIAANVRRVLEKLYGSGNVAVSVKGTLNMEKLIQESTQYTTPEKIDERDKLGLLEKEDLVNEDSAATDISAGGVAGADANADTPRYTTEDNTQAVEDGYRNSSASREWLFNSLKEQRQIEPGVLENTSIGVVITTDDMTVSEDDLIRLVASSAGISQETARDNITIVRAPGPAQPPVAGSEDQEVSTPPAAGLPLPLPIIIAIVSGILLLFLLLLLLLLRRRKKKGEAEELADDLFELKDDSQTAGEEMAAAGAAATSPDVAAVVEQDEEMQHNEEIINLRMQRNLRLKQNIGDFVEQNPQIAAKLVQSWLRGETEDIGGKSSSNARRKEK